MYENDWIKIEKVTALYSHTHTHTYTYTHIHIPMHTHTHISIFPCIFVRTCVTVRYLTFLQGHIRFESYANL